MDKNAIFIPMHEYVHDLTGNQFGRLTVLGPISRVGRFKRYKWLCRCACGDAAIVWGDGLRGGGTTSCGCINRELLRERNRRATHAKHGMCGTPTYNSWQAMLDRCRNPKAKQYKNYGGRGIAVCDRWQSFEAFYADMGARPKGMTLDRKDVNGNYEKDNCRWADNATQCSNTRRSRLITANGDTLTASEWKRRTGLHINQRLYRGWTEEEAVLGRRAPKEWKHESRRKRLTCNGETRTIQDWAVIYDTKVNRIHNRLSRGWSVEEALTGARSDD